MRDLKIDPRRELKVHTATWDCSTKTDYKYKQLVVIPEYNKRRHHLGERPRGLGSCPWTTTRWSKVGVDAWGRGCHHAGDAGRQDLQPHRPADPRERRARAGRRVDLRRRRRVQSRQRHAGARHLHSRSHAKARSSLCSRPRSSTSPSSSCQDQRTNIKKGLFIDELDTPGKTPRSRHGDPVAASPRSPATSRAPGIAPRPRVPDPSRQPHHPHLRRAGRARLHRPARQRQAAASHREVAPAARPGPDRAQRADAVGRPGRRPVRAQHHRL